jgi:hypothetical protein
VIPSAITLIDQTCARHNKGLITAITSPDASRSWTIETLRSLTKFTASSLISRLNFRLSI